MRKHKKIIAVAFIVIFGALILSSCGVLSSNTVGSAAADLWDRYGN